MNNFFEKNNSNPFFNPNDLLPQKAPVEYADNPNDLDDDYEQEYEPANIVAVQYSDGTIAEIDLDDYEEGDFPDPEDVVKFILPPEAHNTSVGAGAVSHMPDSQANPATGAAEDSRDTPSANHAEQAQNIAPSSFQAAPATSEAPNAQPLKLEMPEGAKQDALNFFRDLQSSGGWVCTSIPAASAFAYQPMPGGCLPENAPPQYNQALNVHPAIGYEMHIEGYTFIVRPDGLYGMKDNGKDGMIKISGPFAVTAQIVDECGIPLGFLVDILGEGYPRQVFIPRQDPVVKPFNVLKSLTSNGLWISSDFQARRLLCKFINHTAPASQLLGTTKTGWHHYQGEWSYVLPGRAFSSSGQSPFFIAKNNELTPGDYCATCTPDAWQKNIGILCAGNHMLVFAISAALSGLWLPHFDMPGVGVHFWAPTSKGKSTMMHVAASVGLGKPENLFRQWNVTANGLEGVCQLHNHSTFILDEIGEVAPRELYNAIYMISNGVPKRRYTDSNAVNLTWRLTYLSTGEVSSYKYLKDNNFPQRPGQAVRLLDIPAEVDGGYGVFHHIPYGFTPETLSLHLQDASQRYRGAVAEAYIASLVDHFGDAIAYAQRAMDEFARHISPPAEGQIQRAHRYFALIAAAGEWGIQQGILPWAPSEAIQASAYAYQEWLGCFREDSMPETERILLRLKTVMERYGQKKFLDYQGAQSLGNLGSAFGYRHETPTRIELILPNDGFARVFEKFDTLTVCRALKNAGMLLTEERNYKVKRPLPGNPNARCYVIVVPK